jgi:hypothetical protein
MITLEGNIWVQCNWCHCVNEMTSQQPWKAQNGGLLIMYTGCSG